MSARARFEGLAELRDGLRQMPAAFRAEARQRVRDAAVGAQGEIIRQYPKRTGHLRRNVVIVQVAEPLFGAALGIRSRAVYARFVDARLRVLVPTMIRRRAELYRALGDMLRRAGFEVRGIMTNSNDVVGAVMAALGADPALKALMPGGVFFGMSQGPATQYVIVTLDTHEDQYQFNETAFERFVVTVTAVELATSDVNGDAAQLRIHTLLQDVPLTITGYAHGLTRRLEYVRFLEVDELDRANRRQHRGGRYEVVVAPTTTGETLHAGAFDAESFDDDELRWETTTPLGKG